MSISAVMASRQPVFGAAAIAMLSTALLIVPNAAAQPPNRTPDVVGEKLTDGQAYGTLVRLEHQPGATWRFVMHVTDPTRRRPGCEVAGGEYALELDLLQVTPSAK